MPVTDTARIYLQLVRRDGYRNDTTLRVVSATLEPPTTREPYSIVVALKINVPRSVFIERKITAVVDVDPEQVRDVIGGDVQVEVV